MDLGDFFGDMFNDDYWNSDSTGSGSYQYYQSTDEDGKTWTVYATESYSFSSYIPHHHVNIEKILDRINHEEQLAVESEDYETAAGLRDKSKRIKKHEDLLKKLYDLKERAIKSSDYSYAIEIKDKIQELINGKEVTKNEDIDNSARKE